MLNVPIDVCYTAWPIHTQYQARDGNDRKLMVMTRNEPVTYVWVSTL